MDSTPNPSPALPGGKGTVLVIEDEEVVRKGIASILSKGGYAVLSASDGVEGLEKIREHAEAIDLVLLDLSLPRMSGAEVIAHLKGMKSRAKVLVLSGYEAQAMGVSGVPSILKPVRVRELLAQVGKALEVQERR
ncbi:MAG: response regulator [Candidatus Latescibacteria bacterium]|nr:response regulator [Candidatus Latescibacterota bacterium]